jgi:hypothetical protein
LRYRFGRIEEKQKLTAEEHRDPSSFSAQASTHRVAQR